MLDRIVLVGAGRTGESLLLQLAMVAPVIVIDTSERTLVDAENSSAAEVAIENAPESSGSIVPAAFAITRKQADGTSRLVLEDLRGPPDSKVAIVAATGDDRTNLEVCRLGRELNFEPVVAVAIDPASAARYESLGARAIVQATLLADHVEHALRNAEAGGTSMIGLGRRDVTEVRVLPSSPYLGTPLSQLDPIGWRVATIYRKGVLVIPTGDTVIEANDRVLLVGDPEILPRIAEDFRVGVPDFPLRFGPNVVAFMPGGASDRLVTFAKAFAAATSARRVEQVVGGDEAVDATIARLATAQPGVVVSAIHKRSLGGHLFGSSGVDGRLCDRVRVPVLFSGGAPPYRRIVFIVAGGLPGLRVADVAIDLARMMNAPLSIALVELPSFFGANDVPLDQIVAGVVKRADLHRLSPEIIRAHGNPITEVRQLARPDDLLVVTRVRGQRDSFSSPDVALRIVRATTASALVFTGRA